MKGNIFKIDESKLKPKREMSPTISGVYRAPVRHQDASLKIGNAHQTITPADNRVW